MNLQIKTFIAASILGLTAAAGTASASGAPSPAQGFSVSYADLDLSTEAGNQELYKRIREAAEQACPLSSSTGTRIPARDRQCVDTAVSQAVKNIHSTRLAQVHASFTRRG